MTIQSSRFFFFFKEKMYWTEGKITAFLTALDCFSCLHGNGESDIKKWWKCNVFPLWS